MPRPQLSLKTLLWLMVAVALVSWASRPNHEVGHISWATTKGVPGGVQTVERMDGRKYEKRRGKPIPWRMEGEEIVLDGVPD